MEPRGLGNITKGLVPILQTGGHPNSTGTRNMVHRKNIIRCPWFDHAEAHGKVCSGSRLCWTPWEDVSSTSSGTSECTPPRLIVWARVVWQLLCVPCCGTVHLLSITQKKE